MEYQALERMEAAELSWRHDRCRRLLAGLQPEATGLLAFSRVTIYYLTGTLAEGVFWLPAEGEPVLLLRRGVARARLESPLEHIAEFRSYGDVEAMLAEAGSPLGEVVAAEKEGLSWSLGDMLQSRLGGRRFVPGDPALTLTRAVKSEWELAKMRLAGERHHQALWEMLPHRLAPGMTEREVSHRAWEVFFELGHSGHMRMNNQEIFLGHVAAGDSGNYPSVFNGPVGLRGEHPAVPFMGYAGKVWGGAEPLTCDIGFCLEGYQTDKTQVYWPGRAADIPDDLRVGHEFCVAVQQWVGERLRAGAIPSELYEHSVQWAEKEGLAEGFMALGENKVLFLGHGIGLAIDEYPVLARKFDQPLEEGMVIALEPKFGVPGKGMVGVENTFEVTAEGGRCLTGDRFDMVCLGDL
jgi:Xaa-Pro dipeptidase